MAPARKGLFAGFSIGFDIFYSTNSPENKRYAELIYAKLREQGLIEDREIMQYYCEHDKRFLPDRFIVGTCPTCGDGEPVRRRLRSLRFHVRSHGPQISRRASSARKRRCSSLPRTCSCSLINASNSCANSPLIREFFSQETENFVKTWIDQGLKQWCISRDGPVFRV